MDGPVVLAARRALEAEDVDLVLPYVYEGGWEEVRRAFEMVSKARVQGAEAREVADLFFFETAVRVHRQGESAPYTGLKPAGLYVGPVIPVAEKCIAGGSPGELIDLLTRRLADEIETRFGHLRALAARSGDDVHLARRHVAEVLATEVWAHKLYGQIGATGHEEHHGHE
jgi:hypothetical protein